VSGKAGGHGLFTGIRARMRWSQVRGPIPVKKPSTEGLSQRSASVFKFYKKKFPSIPPGNKNQNNKNCDTKCGHSFL
jgi:hypothetical protein